MKSISKQIIDFFLFRTFITERFFVFSLIFILAILTLDLVISIKSNFSILMQKSTTTTFEFFLFYFGVLIIYRLCLEQTIICFKFYDLVRKIAKTLNINLATKLNELDTSALISCKKNWKNFFKFKLFFTPLIIPLIFMFSLINELALHINYQEFFNVQYNSFAILKFLPQGILKYKISNFFIMILKIVYIRIYLELQMIYIRTAQTIKLIAEKPVQAWL